MRRFFPHSVAVTITVAAFSMVMATAPAVAVPTPIDLNTWSEISPPANGNWTVAGGGGSVFQSINGNPTYFVSPGSFANTTFNGKFGVETTGDDDYIGFVFGLQDANTFWLFDWKQGNQSGTTRGFYLSYVEGGAPSIPFGNHHLDNPPGFKAVEANTGTGWADNTVYDFTLTYQDNRIQVGIMGGVFAGMTTIFDIDPTDVDIPGSALSGGNFQGGRFGFYNFSQASVRYQGFTEIDDPVCGTPGQPPCPVVSEPGGLASLALFGLGLTLLGYLRRRRVA